MHFLIWSFSLVIFFFCFILKENCFHIIYSDHCYLFPNASRFFPSLYLANPCHFISIFIKKTKKSSKETKKEGINLGKNIKNTKIKNIIGSNNKYTSKRQVRKKMPKQCNIRQKVYINTTEFIFCWPSIAGHSVLDIPSDTPLEETEYYFWCCKHVPIEIASWL